MRYRDEAAREADRAAKAKRHGHLEVTRFIFLGTDTDTGLRCVEDIMELHGGAEEAVHTLRSCFGGRYAGMPYLMERGIQLPGEPSVFPYAQLRKAPEHALPTPPFPR